MITIKSAREIEKMRTVGKMTAEILSQLGSRLRVGMSTEEINTLCHEMTLQRKAIPATLNYNGFPKSVCTSRNNCICHGIPNPKEKLADGDIINIDCTSIYDGFFGDTNRTFFVGNVSSENRKLVEVTHQCLMAGIAEVAPGKKLGDIGAAIQEVAEAAGFSVVRDYCGHGIGREFHEDPQVSHVGKRGTGLILKEGMTFTIEPMINAGHWASKLMPDGWTVLTKDGSWSAQFEHTLVVTAKGAEILTPWPDPQTAPGHLPQL